MAQKRESQSIGWEREADEKKRGLGVAGANSRRAEEPVPAAGRAETLVATGEPISMDGQEKPEALNATRAPQTALMGLSMLGSPSPDFALVRVSPLKETEVAEPVVPPRRPGQHLPARKLRRGRTAQVRVREPRQERERAGRRADEMVSRWDSLTTGSRQRPGGLLLFAYTFAVSFPAEGLARLCGIEHKFHGADWKATRRRGGRAQGKLWISLGYDSNGFEAGAVESWWRELLSGVDKFLLAV